MNTEFHPDPTVGDDYDAQTEDEYRQWEADQRLGGDVFDTSLEALEQLVNERPPWLIEGVIGSGSQLVIWAGVTGSGKSTTMLDIALHLADDAMESWHGCTIARPAGEVWYIDLEDASALIAARLLAWKQQHDIDDDAFAQITRRLHLRTGLLYDDSLPTFGAFDSDPRDGQFYAFCNALALARQVVPSAIIVDTRIELSGADDTNDEAQIKREQQELRAVGDLFGCPVIAAAHPSKEGEPQLQAAMLSGSTPAPRQVAAGSQRLTSAATQVVCQCNTQTDEFGALIAFPKTRFAGQLGVQRLDFTGYEIGKQGYPALAVSGLAPYGGKVDMFDHTAQALVDICERVDERIKLKAAADQIDAMREDDEDDHLAKGETIQRWARAGSKNRRADFEQYGLVIEGKGRETYIRLQTDEERFRPPNPAPTQAELEEW